MAKQPRKRKPTPRSAKKPTPRSEKEPEEQFNEADLPEMLPLPDEKVAPPERKRQSGGQAKLDDELVNRLAQAIGEVFATQNSAAASASPPEQDTPSPPTDDVAQIAAADIPDLAKDVTSGQDAPPTEMPLDDLAAPTADRDSTLAHDPLQETPTQEPSPVEIVTEHASLIPGEVAEEVSQEAAHAVPEDPQEQRLGPEDLFGLDLKELMVLNNQLLLDLPDRISEALRMG